MSERQRANVGAPGPRFVRGRRTAWALVRLLGGAGILAVLVWRLGTGPFLDGVRTMQVGTAIWAIAFVLLLPFYGRLEDDGHLWWLWTCVAGFGLGLVGWDHTRRRRKARKAQE